VSHPSAPLPGTRETLLVLALAFSAAIRVLAFSAAFPFFANVDEHKHVGMVLKYARGYVPRPGGDAFEPEMGTLLGMYGSPEYLQDPRSGEAALPPVWRGSPAGMLDRLERNREFLSRRPNKEAHQPPLYYLLGAAWLRIGRLLGVRGGELLYWVRALNALLGAGTLVAAYALLRGAYPADALVRLGLPALLAVFPQDALYYVTPDAASPLLGGLVFCLAARLARGPAGGLLAYAAAGLAAAAAVLAKYTNLALWVPLAAATARALAARPPARSLRAEGGRWMVLWCLAALPVAAWLLRNQWLFGDPTASALKVERLGWGRKAFPETFDHPLFTPSGAWTFATDLLPTFWRGELAWHRATLFSRGADLFYTASSILALLLAGLGLRGRGAARGAGLAEGLALLAVLASVALLAALSLLFAFTETTNPSSLRPYFTQGRLIAGALVPFLLLYLRGIQVATSRLPGRLAAAAGWMGAAAAVAVVGASELRLTRAVFASPYNWFHLPEASEGEQAPAPAPSDAPPHGDPVRMGSGS
jgi:hypothetical protein